jgi:DNA polymerase III delta subunit
MLTLLLGPDDFSKKQFITHQAKLREADLVMFGEGEQAPHVSVFLETDLFSRPKVFALLVLPAMSEAELEKILSSANSVVVSLKSLDKRKKENKELLANPKIQVKEFGLPHGKELDAWIIERVKSANGNISAAAANALAVALGRDEAKETKVGGKVIAVEEVYDLWQADSEIQKLISFAKDREITEPDVKALISENKSVDVFDLTNAIADNEKEKAMELLHKFLAEQTGSDEKGSVIQLNALLSEQFRNVAAVQDFVNRKISESEILEQTGWKSGRLFVMKKIAGNYPSKKILELLNKLEALDEELKTTQTPPKVLLDLILTQLFI